ncbi:hypothetical protein PTKIN_Ptkin11bG0029700 [Pterospermum kingtungense]
MEEALNLFNSMPKRGNLSWNSMISGFAQLGPLELAREYFEMMVQKNLVSWNSIIASVCTGLVDMHLGMQIHQLVSKTVVLYVPKNSLITMYSRCGAITESQTIFDEMKSPKDGIS